MNTDEHGSVLRILRQTYTDAMLKTIIPRNTDIRDADFHR